MQREIDFYVRFGYNGSEEGKTEKTGEKKHPGKDTGCVSSENADTGRVTGHGRSFKLLSDKKAIGDHADGFLTVIADPGALTVGEVCRFRPR